MSREYVYFLSHAPTGSLCSLPSFSLSQRRFEYKEKSDPKKRSCSPSQHRTQRPLSVYLGHTTPMRDFRPSPKVFFFTTLAHSNSRMATCAGLDETELRRAIKSKTRGNKSPLGSCAQWPSMCGSAGTRHGPVPCARECS